MIETNIRAALQAQPTITAIVGNSIYPVLLPVDANLPALTFQIVGSSSEAGWGVAGMQRLRVQMDCWSKSYLVAAQLREAVSTALDGYKDANFKALLLGKTDYFEDASLQFRALVEFYIFSTLY